MFENLCEDEGTHEPYPWPQGQRVMAAYGFGPWRYRFKHIIINCPPYFPSKLLSVLVQIFTGIELSSETKIGRRFMIDHFGGTIFSADAVSGGDITIGANAVVIRDMLMNSAGLPAHLPGDPSQEQKSWPN